MRGSPETGVVELDVAVIHVGGEGAPHEEVELFFAAEIHLCTRKIWTFKSCQLLKKERSFSLMRHNCWIK
jgi:hypothetical protein